MSLRSLRDAVLAGGPGPRAAWAALSCSPGRLVIGPGDVVTSRSAETAPVEIISFGYGHGEPPPAHAVFDVRSHFKDPHVNPALRYLTAADPEVMAAVLNTPGIPRLISSIALAARAFRLGPQPGPVTVAVGCAGGRHRSAAVAIGVALLLQRGGVPATVIHRDVGRPVIARPANA